MCQYAAWHGMHDKSGCTYAWAWVRGEVFNCGAVRYGLAWECLLKHGVEDSRRFNFAIVKVYSIHVLGDVMSFPSVMHSAQALLNIRP
jgi:hypothetical protein